MKFESYELKMNGKALRRARQAINLAASEWGKLDDVEAALPALDVLRDGQAAIDKRAEELRQIRAQRDAITKEAVEKVAQCKAEYIATLKEQLTPTGAQLQNPDFALLSAGLITSEEELAELAERNADNEAMRRAISSYAKKNGFEGFFFTTKEANMLDFAESFFSLCDSAAYSPVNGYSAMMIASDSALAESARSCDILTEYDKATGKTAADDSAAIGSEE